MTRKKAGVAVSLVFALLTSAVGATVWVHSELENKISASEFDRYMELIIDRLDRIEDLLRK